MQPSQPIAFGSSFKSSLHLEQIHGTFFSFFLITDLRDFIRVDPLGRDRAIVRWLEDNGSEDYKLSIDLDRLIENLNSDSPSFSMKQLRRCKLSRRTSTTQFFFRCQSQGQDPKSQKINMNTNSTQFLYSVK
ncbi:unnamed protein product [Trichogramma brassicae]|uniref:Uncharacterized protein n=1 Tax=Trichogramma brassicae TaxID=86971 RepID=A0A6H5IRA9_9HYME|nr:unnamed protein product [Trichogramma brassicae]